LIAGVWLIDNARDLQTLFRNFDGEVMDGGEFEKRLMDMFSEFLDERGPNLTIIGARDISSERPSAVLGYQRGLDADENGITYLIEPLFAFGQITARSWQAAQACFEMHIASDFECLAKTMAATGEFRMINPYLPMPHVVLHDLTEGLIYSVESARTRIFDAEIFTAADAMRVAPAMYLQPEDISDNLLERLGSGCRIVRDAATSTWCIISYLEDKLAENFDNPDDAKRALIWLAGAHLPSEWEVIAADPAGLILEIRIPRSKPATVYAEECRMHFPGQQFYEAKPLSPQFVN
jgi:hypothetical protein